MGPISYLIVEFPENKMTGEGLQHLVNLVDQGLIRILDLVFVTCAEDGSLRKVELHDIDADGEFDVAIFEGVDSGILDGSDLAEAEGVLKAGTSGGILVFENRWATSFVQALRKNGAQLVAAGYIPQDVLAESVDATED
jgi:hypothetical protein